MAIFLSPSDGLALLDHHWCPCKQGQRYKEVDSEQLCSLQSKVWKYRQLNGEVMSTAAAYVVLVLRINRLVQFWLFVSLVPFVSFSLVENISKLSIPPEIPLQNSPFSWGNKNFKYLGIAIYPKVDKFFYSSPQMLFNTVQQS